MGDNEKRIHDDEKTMSVIIISLCAVVYAKVRISSLNHTERDMLLFGSKVNFKVKPKMIYQKTDRT